MIRDETSQSASTSRPAAEPGPVWRDDERLRARTHRPSGQQHTQHTEKIDGVVATILVLDRAGRCRQGTTSTSVYDQRGLLVL